MSAYRDRPLQCPHCSLELRREGSRDIWRCPRCSGALVAVEELIKELATQVPALVPDGGARNITTLGRHTTAPLLTCPSCSDAMEPVFLGGVEVERCYHDHQFWLDAGEPERIIDRAHAQGREQLSWFGELLRSLRGNWS